MYLIYAATQDYKLRLHDNNFGITVVYETIAEQMLSKKKATNINPSKEKH